MSKSFILEKIFYSVMKIWSFYVKLNLFIKFNFDY